MTRDIPDTVDKVAMIVGGGLIILGTTVMGIAESFLTDHTYEPNGNLGDAVLHTTHNPEIRAYLIALGLAVWFLYALYRLGNRRTSLAAQQ